MKPRMKSSAAIFAFVAVCLIGVWLVPNLFEARLSAAIANEARGPTPEPDDIVYDDEQGKRMGFVTMTRGEYADYYFTKNVRDYASAVNECETLLGIMKLEYGYEFERPEICVLNREGLPSPKRLSSPIICDVSDLSVSAVFLREIVGADIPAWFYVGLRQQRLGNADDMMDPGAAKMWLWEHKDELPPFGDAWLIPDFFEGCDAARKAIISIAAERLGAGCSTYEEVIASWDAEYSPGDIAVTLNGAGEITVAAGRAVYDFEYGDWTWEAIERLTSEVGRSVDFAKDYLELDEIPRLNIFIASNYGYRTVPEKYDFWFTGDGGGFSAAAYAAETLYIAAVEDIQVPRVFKEFLSSHVFLKQAESDGDFRYRAYEEYFYSLTDGNYPPSSAEARTLKYYELICEKKGLDPARFYLAVYFSATDARYMFTRPGDFNLIAAEDGFTGDGYSVYGASEDFVNYLFENYDKSLVLSVAKGEAGFEEALGKDFQTLAREWFADRGLNSEATLRIMR